MNNPLLVRTAFESSYVLGALVTVFSVQQWANKLGQEVMFEIAVSAEESEKESIEFARLALVNLGIQAQLVPFRNPGSGKRYVSGISLAKIFFLERSTEAWIWLDSDTLLVGSLTAVQEMLTGSGQALVVPRGEGLLNFNSGVFASDSFEGRALEAGHEESDFYSDQHLMQEMFRGRSVGMPASLNVLESWGSPRQAEPRNVDVLHYVGEIKPWHIHPGLSKHCVASGCSYGKWFEVEQDMQSHLRPELRSYYASLRHDSANYRPRFTRFSVRLLIVAQSSFRLRTLAREVIAFLLRIAGGVSSKKGNFQNIHPFH